jgi:hypothetical protein
VTTQLPPRLAQRYGVLADLLVPADGTMPSATDADPDGAWRDQALQARPDLADLLRRLMAEAMTTDPRQFLARLQQARPDDFEALNFLVIATYFMNPEVRRMLGRFAEPARPIPGGEAYRDLEDGILDPVANRGRMWRPAR